MRYGFSLILLLLLSGLNGCNSGGVLQA